jgi:hypothetical protein
VGRGRMGLNVVVKQTIRKGKIELAMSRDKHVEYQSRFQFES